MNKFIAFTLFALVASVNCGPVPEDQETDLLMGHERLFSDFCRAQGERVRDHLNTLTRDTSSKITQLFFGQVNEITDDVINVQKEAVEQLTAQLANPSAEVVDENKTLSEDKIAKLIKDGKQAIQEKNGISGILPASKTAIAAMMSAANSAVFTRIAKARATLSGQNLFNGFKSACKMVANQETDMEAALEEAKQEILANNDDAEVQKFVNEVTVTNLNCFTTKNIVRLHGFCDTVQAGHQHFFKMLGMESPLSRYEK